MCFDLHFLVANDAEHLFMFLLTIYKSLGDIYSGVSHFLICVLCFLIFFAFAIELYEFFI